MADGTVLSVSDTSSPAVRLPMASPMIPYSPVRRSAYGAVLLALLVVAVGCASGANGSSAIRRCAPPLGPGDKAVHSTTLRVKIISCSVGRKVALACARFTYGQSGTCSFAGYRWRCKSTNPSGSTSAEQCLAGRKYMSINWID
jgi:hypothetical protein